MPSYREYKYFQYAEDETSASLKAKSGSYGGGSEVIIVNEKNWDGTDVSPTLTRNNANGSQRMPDKDNFNCVVGVDIYNQAETKDLSKPLTSSATDSDHVPCAVFGICSKDSNSMKSPNPNSGIYKAQTSRTIDQNGGNPSCNQGGIAVVDMGGGKSSCNITDDKSPTLTCTHGGEPAVCIQGSMIGRADKNGPQGSGINDDVSFTLNATDKHAVQTQYRVRRLTPMECERLQGYPDEWTLDLGDVEIIDGEKHYFWTDSKGKRKEIADSLRYKALGNSICLPFWKWVCKRISAQYTRDAKMCSLFDGIGGFPYLWEQINGKGSAVWASEIEEFPIAVTKYHFPDSQTVKVERERERERESRSNDNRELCFNGQRKGGNSESNGLQIPTDCRNFLADGRIGNGQAFCMLRGKEGNISDYTNIVLKKDNG